MAVTGTSSFLPVRVCGMPGARSTSSGTCRGETRSCTAVRIDATSASSSSTPSASVTNSGIQYAPSGPSTPTTNASVISGSSSTTA